MTKSELRKVYLAKQKSLSSDERRAMSEVVCDLFFSSFDLSEINFLHCFIPIEKFNEVDTRLVIDRIWNEFPSIRVVVPRVDFATGEMNSLTFLRETPLAPNAWDISEPTHDELVAADEIDMVLVPALCFDRVGHRVGYGKGYYDRFLKRCRYNCVRVGMSYFEPVDEIEDIHDGDVRLDALLTAGHR